MMVCVYIETNTCICIYIYIYKQLFIYSLYINICACIHMYIDTHAPQTTGRIQNRSTWIRVRIFYLYIICVCIFTYIRALESRIGGSTPRDLGYTYIGVYIHIYRYTYMYTSFFIYVYVHIYRRCAYIYIHIHMSTHVHIYRVGLLQSQPGSIFGSSTAAAFPAGWQKHVSRFLASYILYRYLHTYTYVCMSTSVFVYIYTHRKNVIYRICIYVYVSPILGQTAGRIQK